MSKLYVLSGPSGAGLGEIVTALFARRKDLCAVTPITARKMKAGEVDGVGFYFYDLEGWNALKESGDLLEATEQRAAEPAGGAGQTAEGEHAPGRLSLCGALGGGAEGPL